MAKKGEIVEKKIDDWDYFVSGEPYTYAVTLLKYEEANIYKGFSQINLNYEDPKSPSSSDKQSRGGRNISAMYLPTDSEVRIYQRASSASSSTFKPFIKCKLPSGNFEKGSMLIGGAVGTPLLHWLAGGSRERWEYDEVGQIYKRIGKDWRIVGRSLGGSLYKEHLADRFVGDLLHSTFVGGKGEKVLFVPNQLKRVTVATLEAGIREDLSQLRELVCWVETMFPPKYMPTPDIDIFKKLYTDTEMTTDLRGLKEVSYFLCHVFLYFDYNQRFQFCSAYRRLRETQHNFDTRVDLTSKFRIQCRTLGKDGSTITSKASDDSKITLKLATIIEEDWHLKLQANSVLDNVFNKNTLVHEREYGLIHFHRSCEEHYNDEASLAAHPILTRESIADALLSKFRDAIPFTFYALVKSPISNRVIIDIMDCEGLIYP